MALAAAAAAAYLPGCGSSAASTGAPASGSKLADSTVPISGPGGTAPSVSGAGSEVIAMVLYPEMTALDFVGPQYFLASMMGATVHHVTKSLDPVVTDTGLSIVPTITMDECPTAVDVLFVPGGTTGTLEAIRDAQTVEFLQAQGTTAKRITSVCTGSTLLGAAGLLDGYRATSHWLTLDLLSIVGATPVAERYVRDRNRFTAAGVSAGLDFGLALVQEMRGTEYAEAVQLLAEYDPAPPLDAGNRATAPQHAVALLESMFADFRTTLSDQLA